MCFIADSPNFPDKQSEGFNYLKMAADQGFADAQHGLGERIYSKPLIAGKLFIYFNYLIYLFISIFIFAFLKVYVIWMALWLKRIWILL